MNCFQIVSLTYLSQHAHNPLRSLFGCELLSDCIFDIPITTSPRLVPPRGELWIAFRLYLWHTYHNSAPGYDVRLLVVNCFQIVSLTYLSQPAGSTIRPVGSCELLSDCIFDIPITTDCTSESHNIGLWIAFRLYLWHTYHNRNFPEATRPLVVNCFQIVSLTYLSQLISKRTSCYLRCELLSDCIFDIPITTSGNFGARWYLLWIAFRLYLWHTYHNSCVSCSIILAVVNCFQIVSLTYLSQPYWTAWQHE